MTNVIAWYDAHAEDVATQYEDVSSEAVHGCLTDLLPASSAALLDIGAGSGRDAAWLVDKGYEVFPAEPSSKIRALAAQKHPDSRIQWSHDALPALPELTRSGLSFDLILASAVWMHVPQGKRLRAFRKKIWRAATERFWSAAWKARTGWDGTMSPGLRSLSGFRMMASGHCPFSGTSF